MMNNLQQINAEVSTPFISNFG
jgi:hypothetical protein